MKNVKKIGIVGFVSGNAFGIGLSYMKYFSQFGDVEIISHTEENVRTHLDLLVIPGGPDVDTKRYLKKGERLNLHTQKPCVVRERFDDVLLPKYIDAGVPIFGICRGHQTLAVHFGGTLKQHMSHESNFEDRKEVVHMVTVADGVLEGDYVINSDAVMHVNSIHHQVVLSVPKVAKVIARYRTSNNSVSNTASVEALAYPGLPIYSVQWHPEEIEDVFSKSLILNLLNLEELTDDNN